MSASHSNNNNNKQQQEHYCMGLPFFARAENADFFSSSMQTIPRTAHKHGRRIEGASFLFFFGAALSVSEYDETRKKGEKKEASPPVVSKQPPLKALPTDQRNFCRASVRPSSFLLFPSPFPPRHRARRQQLKNLHARKEGRRKEREREREGIACRRFAHRGERRRREGKAGVAPQEREREREGLIIKENFLLLRPPLIAKSEQRGDFAQIS